MNSFKYDGYVDKILFFCLMALIFGPRILAAEQAWSSCRGPEGGSIRALVLDPQNPSIVYAGTELGGVYKSVDGCASWNPANSGLAYQSYILALTIDPKNPSTLYAGNYDGGVSKSTDGAGSWRPSNRGLDSSPVKALAINPQVPATLYAGTDIGIYRSSTGGENWTRVKDGIVVKTLAIDPTNPSTIYAGSDWGIYKSIDDGENWSILGDFWRPDVNALAVDPWNSAIVYAATRYVPADLYRTFNAALYKSRDGGASWSSMSTGLGNIYAQSLAIDSQSPSTLYLGTAGGVYKTINGGTFWRILTAGLSHDSIFAVAIDPKNPRRIYAGSSGAGVLFYPSTCSSATLELSSGAAISCSTAGDGETARSGYATVTVNSGTAPYGTAVFAFKQNGVTVAEAGVPASPPTTRASLFIEYRSDVPAVPGRTDAGTVDLNTGIAIVNRGSDTAHISFSLRNLSGTRIAAGSGSLKLDSHFAKFIDQVKEIASDFAVPPDFPNSIGFGTLEITSDQPLSVLALRMVMNQRSEALLTTTPMADLTRTLSYDTLYFPQFADGGGYTTSLILLNTSEQTENGTLQILDDSGSPLVVTMVGGTSDSSFRYSIPSGGAFRVQSDGFPATPRAGWVRLVPDFNSPAPAGSAIFSYNSAGVLVSESGVPSAAPTKHARIYFDLTGNHNTGLAIASAAARGSGGALILANVLLSNENTFGTLFYLPDSGHTALFADQVIPGLELLAGSIGVLDISSETPFAALTLRSLMNERNDFLMSTFPVADTTRPAPSPIIFPQIADGGGYTTETILLSPGSESSSILDFFDESGALASF
jgi:hypothetical protein